MGAQAQARQAAAKQVALENAFRNRQLGVAQNEAMARLMLEQGQRQTQSELERQRLGIESGRNANEAAFQSGELGLRQSAIDEAAKRWRAQHDINQQNADTRTALEQDTARRDAIKAATPKAVKISPFDVRYGSVLAGQAAKDKIAQNIANQKYQHEWFHWPWESAPTSDSVNIDDFNAFKKAHPNFGGEDELTAPTDNTASIDSSY